MNLNCQPPVQIELLIQIHPKSLILIGGSDLDRQMVVQRLSSNSLNLVPEAEADTENLINWLDEQFRIVVTNESKYAVDKILGK